jgi:hypothetical protein
LMDSIHSSCYQLWGLNPKLLYPAHATFSRCRPAHDEYEDVVTWLL